MTLSGILMYVNPTHAAAAVGGCCTGETFTMPPHAMLFGFVWAGLGVLYLARRRAGIGAVKRREEETHMRVITGSARGRRLKELEGMETRPTTDRVKEGLFSALQFEIEGRRVLDLFAGTGQLGIECLSRGAAPGGVRGAAAGRGAAGPKENLRTHGPPGPGPGGGGGGHGLSGQSLKERFDLVLLDPPYRVRAAGAEALGSADKRLTF